MWQGCPKASLGALAASQLLATAGVVWVSKPELNPELGLVSSHQQPLSMPGPLSSHTGSCRCWYEPLMAAQRMRVAMHGVWLAP